MTRRSPPPPKSRVIHFIGTGQGTGMSGGGVRGLLVSSRLEDDDRLDSSSSARGGYEFARICDCFDIKQDHPCVPIECEIIEQIAEVDVQCIAKRDDATEASSLGCGPLDQPCHDCA